MLCVIINIVLMFASCGAGDVSSNPTSVQEQEPTVAPSAAPSADPIRTGWYTENYKKYYYLDDGTLAIGKHVIDGRTYYFGPDGAEIVLANPWNYIPDDYDLQLVKLPNGLPIHVVCYNDLMDMVTACNAAGHEYIIDSAYRSFNLQMTMFTNGVRSQMRGGTSRDQAERSMGAATAIPGTSEHQLGLAIDIVDKDYGAHNDAQANTDTQKWLMANSWKYGFILRYQKSKTSITGIIFEPWHYRYVGKQAAKEIYESGMCLEEYLESLN